jgi:signal peptidase I
MKVLTSSARIVRRVTRIVMGLAVAIVLIFGIVVVVPKLLGYQTYVITTGSMAGTANPGSLVVARTVPTATLAVGDVITYVPPPDSGITHPVTHRVVEITTDEQNQRTFQTKGDANTGVDPWVFQLESSEQPRMVLSVPLVGWPVLLLADRTVRLVAIGGPALLVALLALADAVRALLPVRREPAEVIVLDEAQTVITVPEAQQPAPKLTGAPTA